MGKKIVPPVHPRVALVADFVGDSVTLADGFEDAIIGIVERCGLTGVVCYDYEKCVRVLMKRDKMDHEQAVEWMDYNVVGAYVGDKTPFFLHRLSPKKDT